MRRLTNAQAVRAFLAAQGFARPRPTGAVTARHFRRTIEHVTLLQIDSVNVVTRAHYVPIFARLGPYDRTALDRFIYERRAMFEYWCHEQSYAPVELYPAMRSRMAAFAERPWRRVASLQAEEPRYIDSVLDEVAQHGPIPARALSDPGRSNGPWWGYGKGKIALEYLFALGKVSVARRHNFERHYDLPERVIPAPYVEAPPMPVPEATAMRLRRAIRSLAVATAADLGDYFRMKQREIGPVIERMVGAGELIPVTVDGWDKQAYTHPELRIPRQIGGASLVAPFDSLVWDRARTERVFGFHYRIEIYVPESDRRYGYYVFPFRLGDAIVARIDLKADRKSGVLRVRGAFLEEDADRRFVARELRNELERMATWLELDTIEIGRRGDLIGDLRGVS